MALIDDPKVAALVEREVTKAVKAETKRVLTIIKDEKETVKKVEEKPVKKALNSMLADLAAAIKSSSDAA